MQGFILDVMDEEEEVVSGRVPARPSAHHEPGAGVASHHIAFAESGQHVGDGSRADDEINFPATTDLGSDATPFNAFTKVNGGGSG